jgi:PAS domain S-box-containing protein
VSADTFEVLARLSRDMSRGRTSVIVTSLAALGLTLVATFAASSPEAVGPSMLLPWVALLAFEIGPSAGLLSALAAFGIFLGAATGNGFDVTPLFVAGRGASFCLIGLGVGLAGRKLRESKRRSERLVEELPLVMYVEDDNGLTYISPQIEPLLGYRVSAWLEETGLWRRVLDPRDRDRVLAGYTEAVASRTPFGCDYRLRGANGRTVWVRDSSTYVADGNHSYRQGFIVDVTQEKESEAKLRRNATLMRGLIDGTVDGIALTDRDGRIVVANRPMLQFAAELGLPQEGPIHERLLAITDEITDRDRFTRRMHELADAPDVESFDEFELHGSERVFQGFTRPVIGDDGEYLGRVWTLREVTAARQVDRIKDSLVATVSHELRTPLTSIIGYLELVGTGEKPLPEEDAHYVEIVQRNASRLQHMVEELLFLGRVDAEGLSLDLDDVDVTELARNAMGSALPVARAQEITLEFEEHGPSPARVDAKRLGQVFDNLISNAIKFTPAGGSVTVTVRKSDDSVVARVTDTGCGVPQQEQSRLFERFFRSSATQHVPGTGLGLTIVRAIVESHGGSITFYSQEGEGTTFTFSLPLTPTPSKPPRSPAARQPTAA